MTLGKTNKPRPTYSSCPFCSAHTTLEFVTINHFQKLSPYVVGYCTACEKYCIGEVVENLKPRNEIAHSAGRAIIPIVPMSPPGIKQAPKNLPSEVIEYYEEARQVFGLSTRGALMLLRGGLEQMCELYDCKGGNLSKKVESLCKKFEFDNSRIKAAHILRNEGNIAAHDYQTQLSQDVIFLFNLFLAVSEAITYKNTLEELYSKVPNKEKYTPDDE